MARLAVYTFAILREITGHPRVQGFFDANNSNFEAAERAEGFIARSGYDDEPGPPPWGEMVYPRFFRNAPEDWSPATLSLWRDLESIHAFAYRGVHAAALRHRREWFEVPAWPTHAAWWVGDDHVPDWPEAVARHEHLHDRGPTPHAFPLDRAFDPAGTPVTVSRTPKNPPVARQGRPATNQGGLPPSSGSGGDSARPRIGEDRAKWPGVPTRPQRGASSVRKRIR